MPGKAELALILSLIDEATDTAKRIKGEVLDIGKSGLSVQGILQGVGTALAVGLGAATAVVAGAVAAGDRLVEMAAEEQVGIARLGAAVGATGGDWGIAEGAIESYLAAETKRIALDDGAGRESLMRLTAATGDYQRAMALLPLAADLAQAKSMDLAMASEIVGKVASGNVAVLARYGIQLEKGASAEEALAALQARFAGQAEAYGNSLVGLEAKRRITFDNMKEDLGSRLMPLWEKFGQVTADALASPAVQSALDTIGRGLDTIAEKGIAVLDAFERGGAKGGLTVLLGRDTANTIMGVVDTLGSLLETGGNVLSWLTQLDPAAVAAGASFIAVGLAVAQVLLHIPQIIAAFTAVKAAVLALNVVMAANPLILIAMGIVAAGLVIAGVLTKLNQAADEHAAAQEAASQRIVTATETYDQYRQRMVDFLREQNNLPAAYSDAAIAENAMRDGIIMTTEAYRGFLFTLTEAGPALQGLNEGLLGGMQGLAQIQPPDLSGMIGSLETQYADAESASAAHMERLQDIFREGGVVAATALSEAFTDPQFVALLAESSERSAEIMADMADVLSSVTEAGEANRLAIWSDSTGALGQLMQEHVQSLTEMEFGYRSQQAQAEQVYQAQRAALQAAGAAEKLARLDAEHIESQSMSARDYAIQQQMQQRSLIQQQITQVKAYIAELTAQQNKIQQALAMKLLESEKFQGLEAAQQIAILQVIHAGTAEKLRIENEAAQKSVEIANLAATGQIEAARSVAMTYAATAGGAGAAIDEANAQISKLQQDLASFRIELPPLQMPEFALGAGASAASAGAAAKKATEPATAALSAVVKQVDDSIKAALSAIDKLVGFDIPAGVEAGLDRFGEFAKLMIRRVYGWVNEPLIEGGKVKIGKAITSIQEAVGGLSALFDMVKTDLSKIAPVDEGFEDKALGYVGQLRFVADLLLGWLGAIDKKVRQALTAAAGDVGLFKELFALVGPDLSKVVPSSSATFETDARGYFGQQEIVADLVVTWLTAARERWGSALSIAGAMVDDVKRLLGLVGAAVMEKLAPSTSATFGRDVDAYFGQQDTVANKVIGWLTGAAKRWGTALEEVSPMTDKVKALFGLVGASNFERMVPSASATFLTDVDAYFGQQDVVAFRVVGWLTRIAKTWGAALAEVADMVEPLKKMLSLVGAAALDKLVPSGARMFAADVDAYFGQMDTVGLRAVGWLTRIAKTWGAAIAEVTTLAENAKMVFVIIGAAALDKLVPSASKTFLADVAAYFGQLEMVGVHLVGWLTRAAKSWGAAATEVAPLAEDIKKTFAITEIGTDVQAAGPTFIQRLTSHLAAIEAGAPLVKDALGRIKTVWASAEDMAADAGLSETIKKVFSILDLSKLFEELQVIKPLGEGERRTALSNVIANFITQLEAGAPLLKEGLARVEGLFDGALDSSIVIADKIERGFGHIAGAIKAGIEITTAENWDLARLLAMIDELALASAAVGNIPQPTFAPPMAPGGGKTAAAERSGDVDSIREAVQKGITEGMSGSVLQIVLTLEEDQRERQDFAMRMGRIETMVATLVTRMEAGGA